MPEWPEYALGVVMLFIKLCYSSLLILVLTGSNFACAQESEEAALQLAVQAARAASTLSADEGHGDLAILVPKVAGWECLPSDPSNQATNGLEAIPQARFTCKHAAQSLDVILLRDPSAAALSCNKVSSTKSGIASGKIKATLFRFFEAGEWHIMRGAVDLRGCGPGDVALLARGNRSESALAKGPAAIDSFAEALIAHAVDVPVPDASQQTGPQRLLTLLVDQSRSLSAHIPNLERWGRKDTSFSSDLGLPLPLLLGALPAAGAEFNQGDCRVMVSLSAGLIDIHEAKNTGLKWASGRTSKSDPMSAYIRRVTDRILVQERKDGTEIQALVDDAVIVRVHLISGDVCQDNPDIISRLYKQIVAEDLSAFRQSSE